MCNFLFLTPSKINKFFQITVTMIWFYFQTLVLKYIFPVSMSWPLHDLTAAVKNYLIQKLK